MTTNQAPQIHPVVGYTLRPGTRHGRESQWQYRAYARAIERAGGIPLALPLLRDPTRLRTLYERCDAIVLPGGADVNPVHYGQEPRSDCDLRCEPELDPTDLALARWSVEDGRPLLAICRGAQVLNVACGGSLWQDLRVEGQSSGDHEGVDLGETAHEVTIEPGSHFSALVGRERIAVNSSHHQAVRRLGAGLRITARAEDGIVEAIEVEGNGFGLGVQCHPEELIGEHNWALRLFTGLTEAARARMVTPSLRAVPRHAEAATEAG